MNQMFGKSEVLRVIKTILCLTVVGLLAGAASAGRGPSHTSIAGIYALGNASRPIPETLFMKSNIDGVALRYWWKDLEPREGVYNWAPIARDLQYARAHGKKVSISVTAGVGTPDWVYARGAGQFTFRWTKAWGPAFCSQQRIPIPWDSGYLAQWTTFVRALGLEYDSDSTIVLVKITGLNGASQETNLPHAAATIVRHKGLSCRSSDDIEEWSQLGYSPDKVMKAWKVILDAFALAFSQKQLAVMTGPSFPRLGVTEAALTKHHRSDGRLAKELILDGIQSYGARFVVQNNALSAFWNWRVVESVAGRVDTGYQMLWSVTNDPKCRMNHRVAPCDPRTTLQSAIDRGLTAGARYLEVYSADIENPQLQDVIARARSRLRLGQFPGFDPARPRSSASSFPHTSAPDPG